MLKHKRKKSGFTIVELLVVIVVIGILATISFVSYVGVSDKSKDSKRKADISTISKALSLFAVDNDNYPIETCNIGSDCVTLLSSLGPYMKKFPIGPDVNEYYSYSSDGNTYTITAIMSDMRNYQYNPASGFSYVIPAVYESTCSTSSNAQISCTETNDGSFVINKFTYTSGPGVTNWTVPVGVDLVDVLVVGGGGAGGGAHGAAGGGAGGFRSVLNKSISGSISITVGKGGVGSISSGVAQNGSASIFDDINASGGGGGGACARRVVMETNKNARIKSTFFILFCLRLINSFKFIS